MGAGDEVGGIDQRGYARFTPDAERCDIGAFEYGTD